VSSSSANREPRSGKGGVVAVLISPDWVCELAANDQRSAEDKVGAGNPNGIFRGGIQLRWPVRRKEDGKTLRYTGAGDGIRCDWHEGDLVHREGMVRRGFGGSARADGGKTYRPCRGDVEWRGPDEGDDLGTMRNSR
jgi:hypothetical protein